MQTDEKLDGQKIEGYNGQRAVVIGAGFGGIAAAIRLRAQGFDTTLIDAQDKPGGRAYVFEQDGFKFDAGPTVVTAPDCIDDLFKIHGRKREDYVELVPVDPMYRLLWEDGTKIDYHQDGDKLKSELAAVDAEDAQSYVKFYDYTKDVFREGYIKLGSVAFLKIFDMLKAAPQLIRVGAQRSVYSTVSRYFKNEKIRQAFSFNTLLLGGNPFNVSSIYSLIHALEREWGTYWTKGGTGQLVSGLVRMFQDVGGKVLLSQPVEKILTEGGRVVGVRTQGGDTLPADVVVSNADVIHTYNKLLGHETKAQQKAGRLKNMEQSISLFVLYFGTNKRWENLQHHNVLFGARYKELLAEIFGHWTASKLPEDFSLYLHAPSYTDDSIAPEGQYNYYVLTPVPHLENAPLDWDSLKETYSQKILDYMEERYMPGLKDSVVTQRLFTPFEFRDRLNAHAGTAFSIAPVLHQSAWFRVHNRDKNFDGLYFVGAGTHPGAGIPGVIGSAEATAAVVAKDFPASVVAQSHRALKGGSKSFSFAANLLGPRVTDGVRFLYAWCRYVDDSIDLSSSAEAKRKTLSRLRVLTEWAHQGLDGEPSLQDVETQKVANHPVWTGVKLLGQKYRVPLAKMQELLDGMASDVALDRSAKSDRDSNSVAAVGDWDSLDRYCHQVAGVVGEVFCALHDIDNRQALYHADELGKAMQLTNIIRDIRTDFDAGRVYIPQELLESYGLEAMGIPDADPITLRKIVSSLFECAEGYYQSGRDGLRFLPFRSALAVSVALEIYRDIGVRVLRSFETDGMAWRSRIYVPLHRKIWLALGAIGSEIKNRLRALNTHRGASSPKGRLPEFVTTSKVK